MKLEPESLSWKLQWVSSNLESFFNQETFEGRKTFHKDYFLFEFDQQWNWFQSSLVKLLNFKQAFVYSSNVSKAFIKFSDKSSGC